MNVTPRSLRAAYRGGRLIPSDVMAHVRSRLSDSNQNGVWISTFDPNSALAAARTLDRRVDEIETMPLDGLVFSAKDCIDVECEPTTSGCLEFGDVAKTASPVVADAIAAGALYVG